MKNISEPLLDTHFFRQAQTATVAKNFYINGVTIFQSQLNIFGTGKEKNINIEFPLYQAIIASISHLTGYSDSLGRVISIIFGVSSGIVLYALTYELSRNKYIALSSMVFFLFFPLNIFYQQAFMIESTVVFLQLSALYSWTIYAKSSSNKWLVFSGVYTTFAFLQKSIYSPFLILPIVVILWSNRVGEIRKNGLYTLCLSVIVLIAWQLYVNYSNTINGNAFFTLGNKSQFIWNFGTVQDRVDIGQWTYRLSNLLDSITKFGAIACITGIVILYNVKKKEKNILFAWLFSMCLYFFIFFRIQSHTYYSMPILPVIAIFASYGLVCSSSFLLNLLQGRLYKVLIILFSLTYVLFFMYKGWKNSIPYFSINQNLKIDLDSIKLQLTEPGHIIFVFPEYDWNSIYTYYLDRKGIVLDKNGINKKSIKSYKNKGYKYIVFYGVQNAEKYISDVDRYYYPVEINETGNIQVYSL